MIHRGGPSQTRIERHKRSKAAYRYYRGREKQGYIPAQTREERLCARFEQKTSGSLVKYSLGASSNRYELSVYLKKPSFHYYEFWRFAVEQLATGRETHLIEIHSIYSA
jgi:hypothetical protein